MTNLSAVLSQGKQGKVPGFQHQRKPLPLLQGTNSALVFQIQPLLTTVSRQSTAASTLTLHARQSDCESAAGFQSLGQLSGVKPQDLQNGSGPDRPPFDVSCQRRHMLPRRVLQSGRLSAAGELTAHRLGQGRDDWRGWSTSCLPAISRVWHQAGGKPSCPCSPHSAVPSGGAGVGGGVSLAPPPPG